MESQNPKLLKLIQTAKSLFMKYGIRRVTVEEICRESDVSKMTFYKYFKNKTDLAKHLIILVTDEAKQKYCDIMAQEIPYEKKVEQLIKMKLDNAEAFSSEFVKDYLHNPDPEIAALYQRIAQETMEMSLRDFVKAQQNGDIRADVKPAFILYFINHMLEIFEDPRLSQMYETQKELTAELMNLFFYGVLSREK